jgi:hypothetical protein
MNPPDRGIRDEEVWTLLFAYGFIVVEGGLTRLANLLIEGIVPPTPFKLWLEMLPLPPRQGQEANSNIDLVAGHQQIRPRTAAGIEYHKPDEGTGWICMTEVKWLEDIATKTRYDPHRNQLARVIENALTFQQPGNPPSYPEAVHVTLLTPAIFKPLPGITTGSRLYVYRFNEYSQGDGILNDINDINERRRNTLTWVYPNLQGRMLSLHMHWVTFEQLLVAMPDSEYKQHLTAFLGDNQQLLQL